MFPQIAFGFFIKYSALAATSIGSSRGIGWPSQLVPSPSLGSSTGFGEVVSSGGNSLLLKTVAFWKFDETTGVRVDSHGSNDLTPEVAMEYNFGLNGNAIYNFEGLSTSNTDIFDADLNGFVGFAVLAKNSISITDDIVNCGQWTLIWEAEEIKLVVGEAPTTTINYNTGTPVVSNQWHLINIEIDKTGGTMSVRVDNGSLSSTAITGSVLTGQMLDPTTNPIMPICDLNLDNAWVYDAPLDSTERSDLWNSGIPLTYPFTTPQTNITIGDRLVDYVIGGTVVDGTTFTTNAQSIPSSATITALNSVTMYGLNRATNYEDYEIVLSNGSVSITLASSGGKTNPTYGLNGNYTFVVSGSNWNTVGTDPIPTGNYTSSSALSAAIGEALNTPWELNISDMNGGNGDATFTGWSMNVDI
jgi:hypothetical protein